MRLTQRNKGEKCFSVDSVKANEKEKGVFMNGTVAPAEIAFRQTAAAFLIKNTGT